MSEVFSDFGFLIIGFLKYSLHHMNARQAHMWTGKYCAYMQRRILQNACKKILTQHVGCKTTCMDCVQKFRPARLIRSAADTVPNALDLWKMPFSTAPELGTASNGLNEDGKRPLPQLQSWVLRQRDSHRLLPQLQSWALRQRASTSSATPCSST